MAKSKRKSSRKHALSPAKKEKADDKIINVTVVGDKSPEVKPVAEKEKESKSVEPTEDKIEEKSAEADVDTKTEETKTDKKEKKKRKKKRKKEAVPAEETATEEKAEEKNETESKAPEAIKDAPTEKTTGVADSPKADDTETEVGEKAEETNTKKKNKKKNKKNKGKNKSAEKDAVEDKAVETTKEVKEVEIEKVETKTGEESKPEAMEVEEEKKEENTEEKSEEEKSEEETSKEENATTNKKKQNERKRKPIPDPDSDTSDSDADLEEERKPQPPPPKSSSPSIPHQISDGRYRNKQRCLTISTRNVTSRFRHLLEDLRTLIPHMKKDSKLDSGGQSPANAVNHIAEIMGCNSILFMEVRKRKDGYLWMGHAPHGPSVKFQLMNIHTMDELRLTGNGMKGSRPILQFDEAFTRLPHLRFIKTLFVDIFGCPRGHPKSKPFVDRIMGFYWADDKIWVRHYQVVEEQAENSKEAAELKQGGLNTSLVEIGPRFCLNPIRIFNCSLFGSTLYANPNYVSPNVIRANMRRRDHKQTWEEKVTYKKEKREKAKNVIVPEDPLDGVFK